MQAQLTLKDGTVIALSDDVYALVLQIVQPYEPLESAGSITALEAEFADLFENGPSTTDLLKEHQREVERERRRLQERS